MFAHMPSCFQPFAAILKQKKCESAFQPIALIRRAPLPTSGKNKTVDYKFFEIVSGMQLCGDILKTDQSRPSALLFGKLNSTSVMEMMESYKINLKN